MISCKITASLSPYCTRKSPRILTVLFGKYVPINQDIFAVKIFSLAVTAPKLNTKYFLLRIIYVLKTTEPSIIVKFFGHKNFLWNIFNLKVSRFTVLASCLGNCLNPPISKEHLEEDFLVVSDGLSDETEGWCDMERTVLSSPVPVFLFP